MKKLILSLFAVSLCSALFAETLEEKVNRLEKKVDTLEKQLQPVIKREEVLQIRTAQQKKARVRAQRDRELYSPEQLNQIETIYQTWGQKRGDEQKAVAMTLLKNYPKANRTGCALLYLAQVTEGEPQIELLNQVIRDYPDCFYFDGVQAGAQARLILGNALLKAGRRIEAQRCFDEIRKLYPDAVTHSGGLMEEWIEEIRKN
ncbi:MAG: tetratricopeptide repeat protein [Lentisphaeria bacterium]|nr:tetratricopeptide repeat protein [Lentisphaeria bacterium]